MEKIIEDLKKDIETGFRWGEDIDETCWVTQTGIMLSRRYAIKIVNALQEKGAPPLEEK